MFTCIIFIGLLVGVNGFFTRIPEGHVGVYVVNGQIQEQLVTGISLYMPIYSTIELVKHIQDNDHLLNTKSVSKEGVEVVVLDIEIANRINKTNIVRVIKEYGFDYDKKLVTQPLAQYWREICAERTVDEIEITDFAKLDDLLKQEIQRQVDAIGSGITIDYVRVSSIVVPKSIKDKRLQLAEEKGNKILTEEKMKRTEIEKATEALVAKRDHEMKAEAAERANEVMIQNAEAERKKRAVENAQLLEATQTNVQRIRLEAIANAEKMELEAKALRMLYDIPEYANVKKMETIGAATDVIYWGDKLPTNVFIGTPPVVPQKK